MVQFLRRFLSDEAGSPATEYALLASLIAVALISGITALGSSVTSLYDTISSSF